MNKEHIDTTRRIDRLEKEQRLWRIGAFLLVVAVTGIGAGQPGEETLSVRKLTVTNGGNVYTRIQPDGILLFNDGKLRATVGSESDSAAVRLFDKTGSLTIIMHVTEGIPQLQIVDKANKTMKTIDFSQERLGYQTPAEALHSQK